MSDQRAATAGHPTPHGHKVGLTALIFGFAAAPIAWIGQLLLNYGLSSYVCYPGPVPRTSILPGWRWITTALLALDVVSVLVALAAGLVSYRTFAMTRGEMQGGHRHLLEVGEGRSRFLAVCGMLTAGTFLLVIVFNTLSLILVPLCGR